MVTWELIKRSPLDEFCNMVTEKEHFLRQFGDKHNKNFKKNSPL